VLADIIEGFHIGYYRIELQSMTKDEKLAIIWYFTNMGPDSPLPYSELEDINDYCHQILGNISNLIKVTPAEALEAMRSDWTGH
jgi:hypothetical protein